MLRAESSVRGPAGCVPPLQEPSCSLGSAPKGQALPSRAGVGCATTGARPGPTGPLFPEALSCSGLQALGAAAGPEAKSPVPGPQPGTCVPAQLLSGLSALTSSS